MGCWGSGGVDEGMEGGEDESVYIYMCGVQTEKKINELLVTNW